ncbi:hypothetical protein [Thalassotalea castellviae]|uniref:STAS/SEC14 domain-containing protein n=1 Tax=Thalassotalea castellviae TaxID=3075612 RepID=A0ABU3A8G9_9GAMM|nr:hypothetical protein [Thalassotalea sp. W431]MDT0605266.1 hypothetical protein [Thalassotalea sp. W431]
MGFKTGMIEGTNIVRIDLVGAVTFDERIQAIHQVCTEHYKVQAKLKILIDARQVSKELTQSEQVILGTYAASREELKNASVAVLVVASQIVHSQAIQKSSELGHEIKLFHTESEALIWLNSK